MKILILGASGMIGSAIYKRLHSDTNLNVYGGVRDTSVSKYFPKSYWDSLINCGDLANYEAYHSILEQLNPDVVINCAGLTKHKKEVNNVDLTMSINATMPHQFSLACEIRHIRFIHISSDCVFSGQKGKYLEDDLPDATDLYGRSKAAGEVTSGGALTLRTSTIGHELFTNYGLLEWFLSQQEECIGYSRAIFSGLPSVVFADVIKDFVLPNPHLQGLYHVSADPINKYELLNLISSIYGKKIKIRKDCEFTIDRSLDYEKFKLATGYKPPKWTELIEVMFKARNIY